MLALYLIATAALLSQASSGGLSTGEVLALASLIVAALVGAVVAQWKLDRANLLAALKAEQVENEKLLARNDYLTGKIEAAVAADAATRVELARDQTRLEHYEPPRSSIPLPLPPPKARTS